ncbi:MAG: hypothetical protein U1D29_11860 [Burkholderiales bacterium]|nr:hypothetical protein [Burkholderiales bacterium]
MTFVQSLSTFTAIAAFTMASPAWAAADAQHDSHHPAATPSVQLAQAKPGNAGPGMPGMPGTPGMGGMGGMDTQMQTMREMHDKMLAAKTPEERNALMAEQMKVMQNSMNMMGGMGPGAMKGKPGDMTTRQGMMEKRMDMMQSMMQMMMDRMQSIPATQ